MDDYIFGIISYKRPEKQITLDLLESIGVDKSKIFLAIQNDCDYQSYKSAGHFDRVGKVCYGQAFNAAGNRNNILSACGYGQKVILLDDDLKSIKHVIDGKFVKIEKSEDLYKLCDYGFEQAEKFGTYCFGIYPIDNELFALNCQPVDDKRLIVGALIGVINNGELFDENYNTKDDYEFSLRAIKNKGAAVRLNRFCFDTNYHTKGGTEEIWSNPQKYQKDAKRLVKNYPEYVRHNNKKDGEIIFRPIKQFHQNPETCKCVRYYDSPRWTGEISDCSLPVTLDTYSNCSFGCVYCFSQYQRGIGDSKESYYHKDVKSINVDKVKKIFSLENTKSQFYPYIKDGRPIQYGGLSDQFDNFERKYGKTLELLTYLREIKYPISFSTKASWVFFDERYRKLFKDAHFWNVKFSIITLNEEKAKKIEVGVPSPRDRLKAMAEATKLGMTTTLRLRPFILGVSSEDYLDLIREAHKAGATAVTTEFFCCEMRATEKVKENYKVISECCGFDIFDFYKKNSYGSGYLRLNRKIKEEYIQKMRALCDELGMRFYVSDAHFKEVSDNGCCCGLPPEFEYSRGNFSYALQIAKEKGEVRWSDIEKDMYFLDGFEFKNASGFNANSSEKRAKFTYKSMKDYLRYLWNDPKAGQNPFRMFEAVMIPAGIDENGDVVYKYNENATFQKQGCNCLEPNCITWKQYGFKNDN